MQSLYHCFGNLVSKMYSIPLAGYSSSYRAPLTLIGNHLQAGLESHKQYLESVDLRGCAMDLSI